MATAIVTRLSEDLMGFSSGMWERRDRKLDEEALRVINPYTFLPCGGEPMWLRWAALPQAETVGLFRERDGLPILMTMNECGFANSESGILPDCWGEVPCAWLNAAQKRAYYERYPKRFNWRPRRGRIPGTQIMID